MAVTWDGNQKGGNITLSGGNLVATVSNTTKGGVRATHLVTGPTYMEIVCTLVSTTFIVGFCNYGFAITGSTTALGADTNGIGYAQDGTVKINNSTLATIQTFTTADRIEIAYHPQFQLFWARTNNGNWNNSVSNNPASATLADTQGGISTATLAAFSLFPAFQTTGTTNGAATATFSTPFTHTAPTGFVTIDTIGAVGYTPDDVAATPVYVGAARKDPVAEANQFSPFHASAYGNYDGTKTIAGNVKVNGSNSSGRTVLLFDRVGNFLGKGTTDGSGNYTIKGRGRNATLIVALDDPNFNALVLDEVAPHA